MSDDRFKPPTECDKKKGHHVFADICKCEYQRQKRNANYRFYDMIEKVKKIVKGLDGYMHNEESYALWLELKEVSNDN